MLRLQRQAQVSTLLNQINSEIRSTLELEEVLNSACCLLGQVLDCSQVIVMVTHPGQPNRLMVQGEYCQDATSSLQGLTVNIEGDAVVQRLMVQPISLALSPIEDATWLEENRGRWISANAQSVLAVATRNQGQVNGVIALQQCNYLRQWSAWEQELLEGVGSQLAIAINQTRLYAEMRRQAEREALLRLITNQIRSTLDFQTVLQTAVQQVRQLLGSDRVVIYQFIDEVWQGKVVVEDVVAPWTSAMGDIGRDNCFSQKYALQYQEGRVRAINNILEAGLDECHVRFLQQLQVKANLIVPIVTNQKLWGLLLAQECRAPRIWQTWEMELMKQLADQLAIAIQQADLYAQIQQAAEQSQQQAQQLKATLEELRTTQAQLIQSEKLSSLGQMVAGIAHEINNAANFIHANLPYALQYADALDTALQAYEASCPDKPEAVVRMDEETDLNYMRQDFPKLLTSMQEGTRRIRDIVLTLRNFSRIDEAAYKIANLHEGLDSTLLMVQHRLKNGARLHKEYGDVPPIRCNPGQLNQVFLNLLNNALDAAGDKADITIRTWRSAVDRVTIAIRDNGPGIPEALQSRIFDPFFTTKEVGQGTGLGLSISYQIVTQGHGGRLYCISQPGEGAEFRVEVPLLFRRE